LTVTSPQLDEVSDVDLGRFCHDLRQYVAAGLLLSQMPGDELLDDEPNNRLQMIRALFGQMRDLIAAEVGEPRPKQSVIDLGELVNDCVQVVKLMHKVSLVTQLSGPTPACGDDVLLRRAVINVLDNAARAAGVDGSVVVCVGEHRGLSFVEVTDDGLGFGHIPKGSGHGMSVVDAAVRACRGRLEISSGPDPGTTVRLLIPSRPRPPDRP
jgi:signal transduction histidine kinase